MWEHCRRSHPYWVHSVMKPKPLEWCLVQSRCSINNCECWQIQRMNEIIKQLCDCSVPKILPTRYTLKFKEETCLFKPKVVWSLSLAEPIFSKTNICRQFFFFYLLGHPAKSLPCSYILHRPLSAFHVGSHGNDLILTHSTCMKIGNPAITNLHYVKPRCGSHGRLPRKHTAQPGRALRFFQY